jgi:heme exporter protein D
MWNSWSEFWDMGGRGAFVWGAYFVVVAAVIVEIMLTRGRLRQARRLVVRDAQGRQANQS